MDLLESSHLWQENDEQQRLPFGPATLEELAFIHTPDYIAAVQQLSMPAEGERGAREELAQWYGFDEGDTPPIPGMHEAAARIVGGTLTALSAVMGLTEGGTFATEDEHRCMSFTRQAGYIMPGPNAPPASASTTMPR